MDRRRFLAASAGIASVSIAGCTALAEETTLDEPAEHHDDHSTRFVYEHEAEELLHVNFDTRPDTPWKAVNRQPESPAFHRLRIRMTPPGDATLDTYRFQLKTGDVAANIYVHPPEAGHEETFDPYRDADWTVIEADYGDGTTVSTGFEVLVYADVDEADGSPSVQADYEVALSGDSFLGDTYIATDQTTIDLATSE